MSVCFGIHFVFYIPEVSVCEVSATPWAAYAVRDVIELITFGSAKTDLIRSH